MKSLSLMCSCSFLLGIAGLVQAQQEAEGDPTPVGLERPAMAPVLDAVEAELGASTLRRLLLVKTGPTAEREPGQWVIFARDAHRPSDVIKIAAQRQPNGWEAKSAEAGNLLRRQPAALLKPESLRITSKQALEKAEEGAKLAKMAFTKTEYQLAVGEQSGQPEWALFLFNDLDQEVGFVVVSATTGAVVHQDFTNVEGSPQAGQGDPDSSGAAAARKVKDGARRAWDWTENAGRETGNFFRELFR